MKSNNLENTLFSYYKSYIHKKTREFVLIELEELEYNSKYTHKIVAYTSNIPKLLPLSHNLEGYKDYLQSQPYIYDEDFNWEDYEIIEVYLGIN